MAIDFPDSPSNGQAFTSNNKTWVFDGTSWNITSGTNSVADGAITTAKVADNAITTAKVIDSAITTAKVAANAVTQAKLAASLSAVTVTTSANRDTAVPSPFTGQLVFLTDTKKVQVWDGSLWLNITLAPPEPPTSLSATALSTTSISVAFTAGGANGSPITNYKYALSTNGGSTYGAFTALNPADALTPITISGLTAGTTYHVKLKAVNDMGDSVESSATSVGTLFTPDAPTNLSASNATITTIDISFTAGAQGGSAISNYQYALSTNGGSSYGSFTALNPADASSPITITGLTHSTSYYIKLKAVNNDGAGAESSALSFTTQAAIDYLVVAGGGGGGGWGGGGGAGGYRSSVVGESSGGGASAEASLPLAAGGYAVTVGTGGARGGGGYTAGGDGGNSVFQNIISIGGGGGGHYQANAGRPGGSGGGGGMGESSGAAGGNGTASQGFAGGTAANNTNNWTGGRGGGGGGASQAGYHGSHSVSGNTDSGHGGDGLASSITGISVTRAGGGAGHGGYASTRGIGGAGGGGAGGRYTVIGGDDGTTNTGSGGGGAYGSTGELCGSGGSGVVILRYPSSYTITIGSGLTGTTTTVGSNKVTTLTAGSGNVSWS